MAEHRKINLPKKICYYCKKQFAWRKKWERAWEEIKFCSLKCKSESKKNCATLELHLLDSILQQRG
ncbi:MAG: DUF2256 domain-containing protein [Gammaproteobacteria bacterium]|jgi:hypothetical protein